MRIKNILPALCVISGLVSLPTELHGATLSLDSFSDGSFDLGSGGSASAQHAIASDFVNERSVSVVGSLENWNWELELNPPSGLLSLSATRLLSGGRDLRYSLTYTATSTFSLLGYSAFELDFTTLTGSGLLEIIASSSNSSQVVQVFLEAPGLVSYPFENMAASSLDNLTGLSVRFVPDETGFVFQLDELRAVPEPSVVALATTFLLTILLARRRN